MRSKTEQVIKYYDYACNDPKKLSEETNLRNRINVYDEDGCTALHLAASNGHIKAAITLLTHGANVNAYNFKHFSPVTIAMKAIKNILNSTKYINIIKLFANFGANFDDQSLATLDQFIPKFSEDLMKLKELFNYCNRVNAENIDKQNKSGNTLLHISVSNGNLGTTILLLKKGARVDIIGSDNLSVLDMAIATNKINSIFEESIAVMELLVEHGAKLSEKTQTLANKKLEGLGDRLQELSEQYERNKILDNYVNQSESNISK